MSENPGALDADVVKRPFGPNEIEALGLKIQVGHIAEQRPDTLREIVLGNRRFEPLDARSMAVQSNDGPGGEIGQMERLSANTASEVQHRRR